MQVCLMVGLVSRTGTGESVLGTDFGSLIVKVRKSREVYAEQQQVNRLDFIIIYARNVSRAGQI
jgi:hypothetical protein